MSFGPDAIGLRLECLRLAQFLLLDQRNQKTPNPMHVLQVAASFEYFANTGTVLADDNDHLPVYDVMVEGSLKLANDLEDHAKRVAADKLAELEATYGSSMDLQRVG